MKKDYFPAWAIRFFSWRGFWDAVQGKNRPVLPGQSARVLRRRLRITPNNLRRAQRAYNKGVNLFNDKYT